MGTCVSDLVESRSPEHGTTTINSKSAGSHAPFHTDLEFLDSRTENASGDLIYEMDSKASMNDRSNVDSGAELSTSDLPLSTISIATASTGIGPTLPLDMGTDNRREAHSASDFGLSLSCCDVNSNNVDSGVDLAKSATNPPTRRKLSRAQTLRIASSDSKSSVSPADTMDEMAELVHTANAADSDLTGHLCSPKDSSSDSDNCDSVSLCSTCSCKTCSSCGSGVYVCSSVDCTCCMADMSSREDEGDNISVDAGVKTDNIDPTHSTTFGHCDREHERDAISSDMEANGDHTKSTVNVLNDVILTTKSVGDVIVNEISAHGSTPPACLDSRHNVTHSDSAVKDSSLVSPVGRHSDQSSDGEESDTFSLCSTCTSWGTCSSCGSDIDICSSKDYPCKAEINSYCHLSTCSDGDHENKTTTHEACSTDSKLDTSNDIGFTEMTDSVDLAVCSSAVELEGCEQSVADDTESLCVEANVDQEAHLTDLIISPQSDVSNDAGTTTKAITLSVVDLTKTVEFEERAQPPVEAFNSELTLKASGSQDQTCTCDETRAPIRDDNSSTRLDVNIHSKSDFKSDIQFNSDDCLSRLSLSDVDESDTFSLCSTCCETCSSCESGSYICSSEDCPCKADMSLWTSSDEDEMIDRDAVSLEERTGNDHVHKTNFSDLKSETKTDSSFDAAKCTSAVELEGHVLSLAEGCSLELNSSTSATQHEASNDEMTINATTTGADYGVCDSPAHSGITFHLKTESDLKDTQFSPDNHHLNPSLSANEDSDAHSLCSTCSCETCSSCGSGSYVCSCEDCARVASTTSWTSSDEDNESGPLNFDGKSCTDHVHEGASLTIKPTDISTDNTEVEDYTQLTALNEDCDPVHERTSPTIDISADSTEVKDCYLESTLIKSTCTHSQAVSNALHTQEQTVLDEASYRMKFMPPSGNFESTSPVHSVLTPQLRTDSHVRDGPFLTADNYSDNSPSSSDSEDSDTVSCCSTCSCTCSCSSCSTCDCSCVEDCDLCRLDGYADTDDESMYASEMEVTDSDYDGDIEDLI